MDAQLHQARDSARLLQKLFWKSCCKKSQPKQAQGAKKIKKGGNKIQMCTQRLPKCPTICKNTFSLNFEDMFVLVITIGLAILTGPKLHAFSF